MAEKPTVAEPGCPGSNDFTALYVHDPAELHHSRDGAAPHLGHVRQVRLPGGDGRAAEKSGFGRPGWAAP